MRVRFVSRTLYWSMVCTGLLAAACGGEEPPPAAPPPPPPMVAPAPVETTTAATPPPAAPEAPPPAPAPPPEEHAHPHHPTMVGMLIEGLSAVQLKPEQKPQIDAIEADLAKLGDSTKEQKDAFVADLAAGVSAGKLDKAKIDADEKALEKATAATIPGLQDATNRLHKVLEPDQRKALVEAMRAKAEEMRAHHEAEMHEHEHGQGGPHAGGPPGGPPPGSAPPVGAGGPPSALGGPLPAGAAAVPPAGPPQGSDAPGGQGGPHEHWNGEHGEHGPGEMMHKLAEELGLTPDQEAKIKKVLEPQMKAQMEGMKAKHEAMMKHMKELGDAFETDKFDAKKAAIGSNSVEMVKEMTGAHVKMISAVLPILTADQHEKFASFIRNHAED